MTQPNPHPLDLNDAPTLPGRWVRSKSPSADASAATTGNEGSVAAGDTCDVTHVLPCEAAPTGNIGDGCLTDGATAPASPLLPGGAARVRGRVSNRHEVNDAVDLPATTVRTIRIAGRTHRSAFECLSLQTRGLDGGSTLILGLDTKTNELKGGGTNLIGRNVCIASHSMLLFRSFGRDAR